MEQQPLVWSEQDADAAAPRTVRLSAQELIESIGRVRARKMFESLTHGEVVTMTHDGKGVLVSCPSSQRNALQMQIERAFGVTDLSKAVKAMSADQRLTLATSTTDPDVLMTLPADRRSERVRLAVAENPASGHHITFECDGRNTHGHTGRPALCRTEVTARHWGNLVSGRRVNSCPWST